MGIKRGRKYLVGFVGDFVQRNEINNVYLYMKKENMLRNEFVFHSFLYRVRKSLCVFLCGCSAYVFESEANRSEVYIGRLVIFAHFQFVGSLRDRS